MKPTCDKPRVLCLTHDLALMTTRELLLRSIGCDAAGTAGLAEFRKSVFAQYPDLLVLCQTLSSEERLAALAFAAEHCPGARRLIFFDGRGATDVPYEHVSLSAGTMPQEFLRVVERMLGLVTTA